MIVAGTGHRPPRLGLTYSTDDHNLLVGFVRKELAKLEGVNMVLTGGAQGFDQALYAAAWELGIPYTVAVPFVGQEVKWPEDAKRFYQAMLDDAADVVIVCDGGYAGWKFVQRDKWLVDHSDVLWALLDDRPEKSGTRHTVEHAVENNKPVTNLWERFVEWSSK
jgi:uncharacterized phage-like protein YoqJ